MASDRRAAASSNSSSTTTRVPSVRRNLFLHHHLSRRPTTTSSASTSAETLHLDADPELDTSDIVIRDKNGDFEVGEPPITELDEQDESAHGDFEEKERQRLADAVRLHQRDRNRAPSEPAELLDAVKASLRAKVAALSDDNWMYEAEDEPIIR